MAFGRGNKTNGKAGPAGTYSAEGNAGSKYSSGMTEPAFVETRSRCCCCRVARVGLMTINLILMAIIFGMSAAAIIGCFRKYMFYWSGNALGNPSFHAWIGWYQYTTSALDNGNTYRRLRDINLASYILGIIAAGALGLSCVLSFMFMLFTCCGRSRSLGAIALPFAFFLFGALVAFYILACIEFHSLLSNSLPWPTWGWCLGIASSLVWLLASGLWLATPSRTKQVKKAAMDTELGPRVPAHVRQPHPAPEHSFPDSARLNGSVAPADKASPGPSREEIVGTKPLLPGDHHHGATTVATPAGASLGVVAPKGESMQTGPAPTTGNRFRPFSRRNNSTPLAAAGTGAETTPVVDNSTDSLYPTVISNTGTVPSAPAYPPAAEPAKGGLGKGAWASRT